MGILDWILTPSHAEAPEAPAPGSDRSPEDEGAFKSGNWVDYPKDGGGRWTQPQQAGESVVRGGASSKSPAVGPLNETTEEARVNKEDLKPVPTLEDKEPGHRPGGEGGEEAAGQVGPPAGVSGEEAEEEDEPVDPFPKLQDSWLPMQSPEYPGLVVC